jgi:hypothetical protein
MKEKIAELYAQALVDDLAPNVFADQVLRLFGVSGSLAANVDTVIEMLRHHAYGQEEMDGCGWDANKMEHLDAFAFDHAVMIQLLGGVLERQ